MEDAACKQFLKTQHCCVIIPAFNNGTTLAAVIAGVQRFCADVLVVDDGSTDGTATILDRIPGLSRITFPRNRGKGEALKMAFRQAWQQGFRYAISIDSDGQHRPDDIPLFATALAQFPGSLIIGARNMSVENVPGKSQFGRKFSNFWFWIETGKKAGDTQSGFRLYPLDPLARLKYLTGRYEFEVEVLVRAAWRGIPVHEIPVSVWYAPPDQRISHFRPFRDFFRISVLNSGLVLWSFLVARPWAFLRALSRENIRLFIRKQVIDGGESNLRKTLSVMVGVFIGILPIWGWQILTAIAVAIAFRLNKVITVVASNISIPPMIPLIIYGSYCLGAPFMRGRAVDLDFSSGLTLEAISRNILQYVIGSIVLAFLAALVSGLITYLLLSLFRKSPSPNPSNESSPNV